MQFLIKATDGANMLPQRLAVRPRHLENMAQVKGTVLCAGGLLDEAGKMRGSVLILDVERREDLEAYLRSEPYVAAGVWEKIEVEPLNVVLVNGQKLGN
ncbi:MAG: hypothetical protein IJF88_09355 [Oscillospiraceae bacterium]|nr:hypothetical protein [Oscillospiraceae bacterium]MBR3083218.1 hypothetical protein [Oscillospiraceae bacterium]MBR6096688.1 hypothetical protein [Oscillospiraceae bacterium]